MVRPVVVTPDVASKNALHGSRSAAAPDPDTRASAQVTTPAATAMVSHDRLTSARRLRPETSPEPAARLTSDAAAAAAAPTTRTIAASQSRVSRAAGSVTRQRGATMRSERMVLASTDGQDHDGFVFVERVAGPRSTADVSSVIVGAVSGLGGSWALLMGAAVPAPARLRT